MFKRFEIDELLKKRFETEKSSTYRNDVDVEILDIECSITAALTDVCLLYIYIYIYYVAKHSDMVFFAIRQL